MIKHYTYYLVILFALVLSACGSVDANEPEPVSISGQWSGIVSHDFHDDSQIRLTLVIDEARGTAFGKESLWHRGFETQSWDLEDGALVRNEGDLTLSITKRGANGVRFIASGFLVNDTTIRWTDWRGESFLMAR